MFGDNDYGYSRFPRLYTILDRGAWDEGRKQFAVPSHTYLILVFDQYIQTKHPLLAERVKHDKRIPRDY